MTRRPLLARLVARIAPADLRRTLLDDLDEACARDTAGGPRWRTALWRGREYGSAIKEMLTMRARSRGRVHDSAPARPPAFAFAAQDARHALRQFRKSPGFFAAAVATLALGIGANTALFTVVKAVLFEPLPYAQPGDLVMIWNPANQTGVTWLAAPEVASYAAEAHSLAGIGAYTDLPANFTGGAEPERVRAAAVTGGLFGTLGVTPLYGRAILPADDASGANDVVVLGYDLWTRRFAADPGVIGRTVQMNGRARQVVGVMPRGFRLPLDYRGEASEAWVALSFTPAQLADWGDHSYFGVARLAPGVTPGAAERELAAIGDGWVRDGHQEDRGDGRWHRSAVPIQQLLSGDVREPLLLLFGAVGVVLLIACANVVNLLLVKSDERRHEVAVRAALGAERTTLVRQALTESLLLALAGGAAGLGVAQAGIILLHLLRPAGLPRIDQAGLDGGVLAFTAVLSAATALLFGVGPALRFSRASLTDVLRDAGRTTTPGRGRLRAGRLLVVGQLACSVALVIGALLLVRTLVALHRVDLGFEPRGVLTAQIALPAASYPTGRVADFYDRLLERLQAAPGVTAAGAIRLLPLSRTIGNWSITIEGRAQAPDENPNGDFQWATAGYFRTMGLSLVRGRFIDDHDRADAPLVVVINDSMAEKYWPGENAIGKRFHMGTMNQPWMTVVGIVHGTHHNAVIESPRTEMYLPYTQLVTTIGGPARSMALVIKTPGDPLALAAPLRQIVRDLDPNLPISDVKTMDAITAEAMSTPRFAAVLLALFAALALTLAAVGIYGTLSTLVAARTAEIGVRLALGAGRASIFRLVVGQGLALVAAGLALGVCGALAVTRLLSALLYGVTAVDPATFVAAPIAMAVVALAACAAPARRAARLDPIVALRER